jgi:hypothetical protein
MPSDIDLSKVQWDETPQIDTSQVEWDQSGEEPVAADQAEKHPGVAGTVAAGLRGMREYLPFARDIGAGAEALRKGVSFEEEKRRQEAMDAALAAEHPYAYGAGEVAGGIGSMLAPEAAGLGLAGKGAKAEEAAAKFIAEKAPYLASETEAKMLTGLGSGAISGAAQEAVHGLGTGVGEERLEHAAEEAPMGLLGGAAGSVLGHGAARLGRKAGELTGLVEPLAKAPTREELKDIAKTGYKAVKDEYVTFKTKPLQDLYKRTYAALDKAGFDEEAHKRVMPALNRLKDAKKPMTLDQLDRINRMLNPISANYQEPENRMMAGIIKQNLGDFLDNVKDTDLISKSGAGQKGIEGLKTGRQYWKQQKKLESLEEAKKTAELRAASTGSGGNFNNAYRQEIRKIYDKNKRGKLYTPDELQAMREFVMGGSARNLLRMAEVLSPVHHRTMGALELLHGFSNPVGTLGAAGLGYGAHYGEQYLANKAANRLEDIIARGGSKSTLPSLNPMESIAGRTAATLAVMAPYNMPNEIVSEDRGEYASGGKVGKRDYPAKRLTRMEKAVKRAQQAIALETKPLMERPDEQIAKALEIASNK